MLFSFSINKTSHLLNFHHDSLLDNLWAEKIEDIYVKLTFNDRLNKTVEMKKKRNTKKEKKCFDW